MFDEIPIQFARLIVTFSSTTPSRIPLVDSSPASITAWNAASVISTSRTTVRSAAPSSFTTP